MSDDSQQPIIVKRIKKGGGGHHGGAWKIAYADFVTAMMAFFLLMWLLGSTPRATSGHRRILFHAAEGRAAGRLGSGDAPASSRAAAGPDAHDRPGQRRARSRRRRRPSTCRR
jgi:chemotaxis protein MotB